MTTPITPRRAALLLGALVAGAALPRLRTGLLTLRAMIAPPRQPLTHTPGDIGLPYESTFFTSEDDVALRGWFIPRANDDGSPAPAIAIVHGWPWNRLGNAADHIIAPGIPNAPVDLLAPAAALHRAGFHTLLFDLRNHGISGSHHPVTFGLHEQRDLAAAVGWLRQRAGVEPARLGLLGFSMGANTIILGLPRVQPIRAVALIQPVQPTTFAARLASTLFGPLATPMLAQTEFLYQRAGGPPLAAVDVIAAAGAMGETAALFVQGSGDPWGRVEDVALMAKRHRGPKQVVLAETTDRYGGYHWSADHAEELVSFFQTHL